MSEELRNPKSRPPTRSSALDTLEADELYRRAADALEFEIEMAGPLVPIEQVKSPGPGVRDRSGQSGQVEPGAAEQPALIERGEAHRHSSLDDGSETFPAYERIASLIAGDSPLHAMHSLEEVSEYVATTVLIPLDEARLNPVFGVGNPSAGLMVIGEAPGADEDAKGEPFVGRAGQLLDKILAAVGFDRGDVYIANILKSRPPNNRNPTPEEVAAHLPILQKQMVLIQPKLILCVGKTSATSLLGIEASLKSMRGRFHDYHGLPVVVTYHPAALLRNPGWKRPTWEDVQLMRRKYDELTSRGGTG